LIAGAFLCALAVIMVTMRPLAKDLASDALVMRALGASIWMTGFMLVRVALRAATGVRRLVAIAIGSPLIVVATGLIIWPSIALVPYARGWGLLLPWLIGTPGILALGLGRWRVS
jgi:hypothetical protein